MGDSSSSIDNNLNINDLPVEIRAKIFNFLDQFEIPHIREVCPQWNNEINEYYEFALNVYDTTDLEADLTNRVKELTIWKLNTNAIQNDVFKHPYYLKNLKISGPVTSNDLLKILIASINLEHLIFTRRSNYPWTLNMSDSPELANLKKIKSLQLHCEEHLFTSRNSRSLNKNLKEPIKLPFMDCTFPVLRKFVILKRYPEGQYLMFLSPILTFLSRHWKSLKVLELDLIPFSCSFLIEENINANADQKLTKDKSSKGLDKNEIDLGSLCKLKLSKISISTKGEEDDVMIWKRILDSQDQLEDLSFDWLGQDNCVQFSNYESPPLLTRRKNIHFPWNYFQMTIENSSKTLVSIELSNISMVKVDTLGKSSVLPLDIGGLFRKCYSLKNIKLKCKENHNKKYDDDDDDENDETPLLTPLIINTGELPPQIKQLELYGFPMYTSDLKELVNNCTELFKLFLNGCGSTSNFGVTADVIKTISKIPKLKFLEIIEFNDSIPELRQDLEDVFKTLGRPYEGQETWLEYNNGSSYAHTFLQVLQVN